MEPDGGNLYNAHVLQINSGQFWRCAHGSTGFGNKGNELVWVGCKKCGKANPEARRKWDLKELTDTDRVKYFESQGHNMKDVDEAILNERYAKETKNEKRSTGTR